MKIARASTPFSGDSRSGVLPLCPCHSRGASSRRALASLALTVAALAAGGADAQVVDPNLWVTDGTVNAVACGGNTIYIGGEFTQVGPATGGSVPIDAGGGAPLPDFPKVAGTVCAFAPDGAGGWYIGGSFIAVGGLARSNVAHIAPDLTVTAWNPSADDAVLTLAVSGSTVYAGGAFTSIGGQSRNNIAALDATSGAATAWNPSADDAVLTLAVSGSTVYVGGDFSSIGGQARNYIAALDATSGAATAWNPNASEYVDALAVSGSTVYVGGDFTSIGGQARNYIAALDGTSGAVTPWNPSADWDVDALSLSGSTVYAGGDFDSIGGQERNNIAALDATSGAATAWNPNADKVVHSLAVSGSTVYAGGDFTSIGGQSRNNIAELDATSGAATAWNPNMNGEVDALSVNGSVVYAGGEFTSIGGQSRNNIAALDATSGAATAWNPSADDAVLTLAVSGSTVYVGGDFTSIGGQARNYIAALDATSGAATAWDPSSNSSVSALSVGGSTVYVGGRFTSIGGRARNNIAALDATSGTATAWNPSANGEVDALSVNGSTVYAGGAFTSIGGQPRSDIAALDATSGAATAWNPNASGIFPVFGPYTHVCALSVSGSTVYAGGAFTSIGGQGRAYIAALDAASGEATAWNPNANDEVVALSVSGSTVYVGGLFFSIGGQTRDGVAALDAASGAATTWNPSVDGDVFALSVSGPAVYAGGAFGGVGGLPQSGIAAISPSTSGLGPFVLLSPGNADSLDTTQPTLVWQAARASDPADTVTYTVYWSGNPNFTPTHAATADRDTMYTFPDDSLLVHHTYYWRIEASDPHGETSWSSPNDGWSFYIRQNVTPAMPEIRAGDGDGGVLISWVVPPDVSAAGFRVYRQASGSGWVLISPTLPRSSGPMTYLDSAAAPGIPYTYEVEVLGPAGPSGRWGPVTYTRGPGTRFYFRVSPNPGWAGASLSFGLPRAGDVSFRVFDLAGRSVLRDIWAGQRAGSRVMSWDGQAADGRPLPAGTYWLRLDTAAGSKTVRWVSVK